MYENNPEGARGTAKKFAWRGRKKMYSHYGVIQFTVADSIFNKYVKKKLSFAHPTDVQDVYDPVTGKIMKMNPGDQNIVGNTPYALLIGLEF